MGGDNCGRLAVALGDGWREHWGSRPLPAGHSAIGTASRGEVVGALLVREGVYVQGSGGALRALDQRKIAAAVAAAGGPQAPARGGARAGAGRPAADGARAMSRRNVMLDDDTVDWLRELGGGELSAGIRKAAAVLRAARQTAE